MADVRTIRIVAPLVACVIAASCGSDPNTATPTGPPGATAVTTTPSTAPASSVPAGTAPATTAPPSPVPDADVPDVVVTDVGWDGDGSACLTLASTTTGCFPGGSIAADGTTAHVRADGADWTVDVRLVGGDIAATVAPGTDACPGDVAEPPDAWLVGLACGQGGAAIWGVLPDGAGGVVRHEAVRAATGEVVALTPMSLDGDLRVLAADLDLEGVGVRCTLVVPRTGGWFESCDIPSPAHPGTRLVVHDGAAYHVDPADGRVVPLADAPMRTNGCDGSVLDIVADRDDVGMLGSLACRDGLATGGSGSVLVQQGPVDGSLVVWQRDDDGTWVLVDDGTGIDVDPMPLPLPPLDLAVLDADAPATAYEDVTETVRSWMRARPELTIADAIAAGEGADTSAEALPTAAMAPLPSLTVVEVGYPDDSVTGGRYAVWTTEPDDGSDPLLVAYRWTLCGRGVDGGGLCV
jgi:hypothetical protein